MAPTNSRKKFRDQDEDESPALRRSRLAKSLSVLFVSHAIVFASAEAQAFSLKSWKPKLESKLHLLPTYYFTDVEQETSQWATVIKAESELSFRPAKSLRVRLAPWIYSDPVSKSASETLIFDANEANLELKAGDWSVKGGLNSIAWGVTDVYNPLDVVSARRYLDPLNSEKRAVPSLDVNWDNGTYRAEAVYVPYQFESIMPGENSRWLPRDLVYNRAVEENRVLTMAKRFRYFSKERDVIDEALRNNFGFRLERRGSGLDLTAIFFQGAPTAPMMFTSNIYGDLVGSTILVSEITLQPIYYLRRTAGVGAVMTFDTTILRFAAANSDRLTHRGSFAGPLPGWSHSAVLGIEQNFPVGETTLTALLQVTYAQHEEEADNSITSLDRIFDQSWLLGFRMATSDDWVYNAAALCDAVFGSWFAQLKVERKITDGLTATFQGEIMEGPPESALGIYRRNDRVTLGATFFF